MKNKLPKNRQWDAEEKKKKKPLKDKVLLVILVLVTFITFSPSLKNNFVNWDDDKLVYQNPDILNLNAASVKTYFTSYYANMYQPATTLSFALDNTFFGLNPYYFHLINILLHIINVVLVFYLIFSLTRRQMTSFFVAFIFALHPMHVESVAWVSERKDVLYTAFFLLSLLFYSKSLDKSLSMKYLGFCFAAFVMSLFSKSAAVTLPLVLVVIDYYKGRKFDTRAIVEKIPFFLLSIVFGLVSIASQHVYGEGSVAIKAYNYLDRFFMGTYSLSFYIIKFFIPFKLSAVHPMPVKNGNLLPLYYYISIIILPVIGFAFYKLIKGSKTTFHIRRDSLLGLLFFVSTIILILSLPVGRSVAAERYTYVPYIGLAFTIVSLAEYFNSTYKFKYNYYFLGTAVAILGTFSIVSFMRNAPWQNSISLFTDVIEKYPSYPEAYNNRGLELYYQGNNEAAGKDYVDCIRIKKDYAEAYFNHGLVFMKTGNFKQAIDKFDTAVFYGLNQYSLVFDYRGRAKFQLKDYPGALKDYTTCPKAFSFEWVFAVAVVRKGDFHR